MSFWRSGVVKKVFEEKGVVVRTEQHQTNADLSARTSKLSVGKGKQEDGMSKIKFQEPFLRKQ